MIEFDKTIQYELSEYEEKKNKRKIYLLKQINCLKCNGNGIVGSNFLKCSICNATGKVKYIYLGQLKNLHDKIDNLISIQKEILDNIESIEEE